MLSFKIIHEINKDMLTHIFHKKTESNKNMYKKQNQYKPK